MRFLCVYLFVTAVFCCSSDARDSYVAAIVEYWPQAGANDNLRAIEPLVQQAAGDGADVVVFPEEGIIGSAVGGRPALIKQMETIPPNPSVSGDQSLTIPCQNDDFIDRPYFRSLSCLARQYKVILMVNYGDKQPCTNSTDKDCPSDGFFLYNTNIVFDKDGSYLAKYHKRHLYGGEVLEFNFPPADQKPVSFNTSIGVKFGTFTCFDMLFNFPAFDLVHEGVKNFLFTTFWGSEFPSLISIAVQQSWSKVSKTNLIAANLHCQESYCLNVFQMPGSGSGIYSAGAVQNSYVSGEIFKPGKGVIRTATVQTNPLARSVKHHYIPKQGRSDVLLKYLADVKYQPLPKSDSGTAAISMQDFNCSLSYSFKHKNTTEQYALGVFYGKKSYGLAGFCIVLKCSEQGCGKPLMKAYSVFEEIKLTGSYDSSMRVFPLVVGSDLTLLDPLQYTMITHQTLTLNAGSYPILSASLWALFKPGETH